MMDSSTTEVMQQKTLAPVGKRPSKIIVFRHDKNLLKPNKFNHENPLKVHADGKSLKKDVKRMSRQSSAKKDKTPKERSKIDRQFPDKSPLLRRELKGLSSRSHARIVPHQSRN